MPIMRRIVVEEAGELASFGTENHFTFKGLEIKKDIMGTHFS